MAATYSSGAVAADGDSYTPDNVTDSCLCWLVYGRTGGVITASGHDFGGSSMTEDQDLGTDLAGFGDPSCSVAHLVAPGTTSQTLSATFSDTWNTENGYAITIAGVDQTTPIYATNGNNSASYTTTDPTLSYDAPADSMIVYWKFHQQSGTPSFTTPTGFTLRRTDELLTAPANITMVIYTRDETSTVSGGSIGADTTAVTGGVHGVLVFQSATAAGGDSIPYLLNQKHRRIQPLLAR